MNQHAGREVRSVGSIVRGGLRRPPWICRNVSQIVIFARDKSDSMQGEKADDASRASIDLVEELASPENKDGFLVAVVDFAEVSSIRHEIAKATALNGKIASLSEGGFGPATNITDALDAASSVLAKADQQTRDGLAFLRAVVILLTDGKHNRGPSPEVAANRLKAAADLVTVAFGYDADEAMLKRLATSPQHAYRCGNGKELRAFLAAVGSTLTGTMAARTNATQALTMVQHGNNCPKGARL